VGDRLGILSLVIAANVAGNAPIALARRRSLTDYDGYHVNQTQLDSAITGLRRLGLPGAIRAAEHLELAVEAWRDDGKRWEERMGYSLRVALEEIPPLFRQEHPHGEVLTIAQRYLDDLDALVDVSPDGTPDPTDLRVVLDRFRSELDDRGNSRRVRVASAMIVQAGTGRGSPQVDAFANEWVGVVQAANTLLHDGALTEEAGSLLDRAVSLLAVIAGPTSDRLGEVDALAAIPDPSQGDVQALRRLLADDRLNRYFFTSAATPVWFVPLDNAGFFNSPMEGDWYQGSYLARVSGTNQALTRAILGRIARDEHPAAPFVVLEVARQLGPDSVPYLEEALGREGFADPWSIAHALEGLLEDWSQRGTTSAFPRIADLALNPRTTPGQLHTVGSKFGEFDFHRLVQLFVAECECEYLTDLTRVLVYKIRWLEGQVPLGGQRLSIMRERIDQDDYDDRDVGSALTSGLRDALRRMRDCGESLEARKAVLGDINNEFMVRLWANHLAEEEASGQ